MDPQAVRAAALIAAAITHSGQAPAAADLITLAGQLVPWITGAPGQAAQLIITAAADGVTVRQPGPGGTMPVTVNATVDNSTVTITVQPEDDHGDVTPDQLTWANDDTDGTIASWAVSADTHTYTGTLQHVEGTVSITAADPAAAGVAPAAVQVIVGPGATSQLVVKTTVT